MHTAVRRGGLLISCGAGAYNGKGRAQMRGINRVRAFATGAAPAYQIAAKVGGDTGMGDSREGHCGGGVDAQCGARFGAAFAFGSLRQERTAR